MRFQNITVVNIDGRPAVPTGGLRAVVKSCSELPGALGLLLSPQCPNELPDGITHVPIQPLGYFEYGLFVLYALHALVSTEYALIVQEDGWVLSGDQWSDTFFDFDIVGAPVHLARVKQGGRSEYLRHFHWTDFLGQPDTRIDIVLNGGFSLRSKRMLEAPQRLGLAFVLPPPTGLYGPPLSMVWQGDPHLEDAHLCLQMRETLEAAGLRFAPLEQACRFAFEHLCPALHDGADLSLVFGHHSKLRRLSSLWPAVVEYTQDRSAMALSYHDEDRIAEVFRRRGYSVRYPSSLGV